MKKKLSFIFICLMTMVMTLSGCSLFQLDVKGYYEQTIVSVDGVEIKKEELIKSLNNYYATYINTYGLSADEAFEKCLDNVVNKTLLLEEAKDYELAGKISFNQYEKNELWRSTFNALNANLETFEEEIKKELGIEEPAEAETEEESSTRVRTEYEPTAKVEWNAEKGEYEIVLVETEEEQPVETEELTANDFVITSDSSENIKKEAKRRYIKQLKKNEEDKGLSTIDDEVWAREVERIYKNYKESEYITKLLAYHEVAYAPTVQNVLDEYIRKVKKSYEKYAEDSSLFVTDLSSDATAIYYVPEDQEQYYYVPHILLGYSKEQLSEMNLLKTQLSENSISQDIYEAQIKRIKTEVAVVEYDEEGNEVQGTKTVAQVLQELNLAMQDAEENEKADIFNKFMFKYSTDADSLTAKAPYTLGLTTSTLMEDYTAKARELIRAEQLNTYTNELDGLAYAERWSDNVIDYGGYHIVAYVGNISNLFDFGDIDTFTLSNKDVYKLATTRVNPLSNKTYFDVIYEELTSNRSFSVFENAYIEQLRGDANIVRYPDNWKDLIQ